MAQLTDTMLRGLVKGKRKSERLNPCGSLMIWHRPNGTKEYYFRRRQKGTKEVSVKLGTYPAVNLATARKAAQEMALKASTSHDLKFQLELDRQHHRAAEEEAKKVNQRRESLGTLADLCSIYISKMKSEERSSWQQVQYSLNHYVLDLFPEMAARKANEITSDDVADVLAAMIARGITTHTNRVRGDLHAAFNIGLSYDYDPAMRAKKGLYFDLNTNPVARIKPVKTWERALSRVLSADELRVVWFATPLYMSPVYSSLLRLMICTGFHPAELLRLKVEDVDPHKKTIYMIQTKSGIPNLIPLNRFAWIEIEFLLNTSSSKQELFPSRIKHPKSDIYNRVSVVANQVARLRNKLPDVEHFTARDIRRTVKTQMGFAGIPREIRDRLQNHTVQDVSGKHYDRYDYWSEKETAARKWENWLSHNVIEDHDKSSGQLIQMPIR